jgi:hypothetical protein
LELNFKISPNLILATHITGVYDVNRSNTLADDDYSLVADWANSITQMGLQGIIFHNNFSDKTCQLHQSNHIQFVKIEYDNKFNPNVFRYMLYARFLNKYAHQIKNIFFTDVSDVVVLKNPFLDHFFIDNPSCIFCGDEPINLDNEWMRLHAKHLRDQIRDYANYESEFKNHTLLNCGIMGGAISVMHPFINALSAIHEQYNAANTTAYTGDMGAFNYLIRTKYNHLVKHGKPINTLFKGYEVDERCWFKHK